MILLQKLSLVENSVSSDDKIFSSKCKPLISNCLQSTFKRTQNMQRNQSTTYYITLITTKILNKKN